MAVVSSVVISSRSEHQVLREWVEYHRLVLGVEHFFCMLTSLGPSLRSAHYSIPQPPYVTFGPWDTRWDVDGNKKDATAITALETEMKYDLMYQSFFLSRKILSVCFSPCGRILIVLEQHYHL